MSATAVRDPAVAGTFYAARAEELESQVVAALGEPASETRVARLVLAPHAGYMYSGAIAGAVWRLVRVPPLVVILAPNHHGIGAPLALPLSGRWRTPLGSLEIDEPASAAISARGAGFRDDWRAHSRDHALEVQLPFVQVRARQCAVAPRLVTVSVGTHDLATLIAAGEALAGGLSDLGLTRPEDVLIAVSSDMSHYIPAALARQLDLPVLDDVMACRPERVYAAVMGQGITMCGVAPAVLGLVASRALGVGEGHLVRYGHSGEVTGDASDVVAYASVLLPPS